MNTTDTLLNDFAIRSFRDTGDGDYISARLAFRAALIPQFLWQSLQATEKYLKCILVLNRVRAPKSQELEELLAVLDRTELFEVRMSSETKKFLKYLDTYGQFRYYETPYYSVGDELSRLDRAIWEIRRYARVINYTIEGPSGRKVHLLSHELQRNQRAESEPPHTFTIMGGYLEKILSQQDHPSRTALIWQNQFFSARTRRSVRYRRRMVSGNSPLSLHPEILDEVLKYVFLPKDVVRAYRRGSPIQD